jgi:ABC-type transport system substrate-binding protein
MIPADTPPSFDAHREATFATVHSAAPFYSVLVRINPENPSSTTDFVCDLCRAIPQPSDDGKTYAFELRDDVKFHDGSPLTAADVAASWRKIVDPPEGVISARQSHFMMIDKIEAPDQPELLLTNHPLVAVGLVFDSILRCITIHRQQAYNRILTPGASRMQYPNHPKNR